MYKKTIISLTIILLGILVLPSFSTAATNKCPASYSLKQCQEWTLKQIGDKSGYGESQVNTDPQSSTISNKIGQIIAVVLAFLGVVFLVLVVFSGIQWMTAGGNEEKVTQARTRLINASVGLAIVMAAYAITWFVVYKLQAIV